MSTKINVRSPYYLQKSTISAVSTLTLDLKIWTGAKTPIPAAVQYSITKAVTNPGLGYVYATFEVSELIRDYIEINFDGDYTSYAVWVNDGLNTYIAVDGYGYFEEGANAELSRTKMISNNVIWRPDDENIRVPVFGDEQLDVVFAYQGNEVNTYNYSVATNTLGLMRYPSASGTVSVDNYKQRVLDDGGTYEFNPRLAAFENVVDVNAIDEVRIYKYTSGEIEDAYESIKVRTMHCDKYPDRKVTFVNKFGAFQDVYFFAKEVESINSKSEEYKSNVMNLLNLSYNGHQYSSMNVQGKESITLNTGFVSEDYNEVLKQLMLSEQVWLTKTDDITFVFPVTPKTQSLTYKTSLNDKLVSYTVTFDYAFDKIQNIR